MACVVIARRVHGNVLTTVALFRSLCFGEQSHLSNDQCSYHQNERSQVILPCRSPQTSESSQMTSKQSPGQNLLNWENKVAKLRTTYKMLTVFNNTKSGKSTIRLNILHNHRCKSQKQVLQYSYQLKTSLERSPWEDQCW